MHIEHGNYTNNGLEIRGRVVSNSVYSIRHDLKRASLSLVPKVE